MANNIINYHDLKEKAVKNVYQDIYDGGLNDAILEEIRIDNIARDDTKFNTNRFRK